MAKKYNSTEGIWRTIGGRRVFIKTGQSLSDAMRDSGKFKKTSDVSRSQYQKVDKEVKSNILDKEYTEAFDKYYKGGSKFEDFEKVQDKFDEKLKNDTELNLRNGQVSNPKAKYIDDLEGKHIAGQREYSLYKKAKENPDSIDPMTENSTDWEALDKKYKDRYISEKEAKESGNDYLPKASKIMTAGTSNRKEVSDNIQAHILEHYDNPVDFMEQMDAMDYLPTKWRAGEELARGGSYLIYNGDMADFLNSLNINPKGKTFSPEKSFDMYSSLVGRESERLYNRLEKLYEKYKSEHKGSDVSLDDFRKWFK